MVSCSNLSRFVTASVPHRPRAHGRLGQWMGISSSASTGEDLTKQPEARVRWYEAAGGTTLWGDDDGPRPRSRRVLTCCARRFYQTGRGWFFRF